MTAIHQFVPSFAGRDAIGAHALQVQRLLRSMGIDSDIFCGEARKEVRRQARRYRDFPGGPPGRTWLLYQCSTGSPLAGWLAARPEALVLDYHNITPHEIYEPWEPHVAVELREGRRQLAALAPRCDLGLADSAFNRAELDECGYRRTAVAPILLDLDTFDADGADARTVERVRAGGGARWLFVGRLSPNKAQHDVVRAFEAYRRLFDPAARLTLVGGSSSHAYEQALRGLVDDLGLGRAVELAGSVGGAELGAHYAAADAFVCLSDHEGFCVPLLEAMHHRVPIVALRSSAVTETLGGAGLLLPEKSPVHVAAAVARLLGDPAVRAAAVEAGACRLADFGLERTRAVFRAHVEALVGAP